jgi:ATP-dependent protease ClpP protease subunit
MYAVRLERIVWFTGDVTTESIKDLSQRILGLQKQNPSEWITLFINSGGGLCSAGFAFYDLVTLGLEVPLQTVAAGFTGSMAIILYLTGKQRIVTPRTLMFLHRLGSTYEKQRLTVDNHERYGESLAVQEDWYKRIVRERTQIKTLKQIHKMMADETYINPSRAIELGFAHELLSK